MSSQHDFSEWMKEIDRRFKRVSYAYAGGEASADSFHDGMTETMLTGHRSSYALGRMRGGILGTQADADEQAQIAVDLESQYLQGFRNDLLNKEDARYWDLEGNLRHDQIHRRARMYSGAMRGSANQGWVDGLPDDEEFDWLLGASEDHCDDCPYFAENSPYTKDTLPTTPGANRTPCLFNCTCRLETANGDDSYERVEYPDIEGVPQSSATHDFPNLQFSDSQDPQSMALFSGNSSVTWEDDRDDLENLMDQLFGAVLDEDEIVNLVAAPGGSDVTVRYHPYDSDQIQFEIKNSRLSMHMIRSFREEWGDLHVHHDLMRISNGPEGTGLRVFSKQVSQYVRYGVVGIDVDAVGNSSSTWNGYYTWPRMGFEFPLDANWKAAMRSDGFQDPGDTIIEFFAKYGRPALDWWKANGSTQQMTFDMDVNSPNRVWLEIYKKERGVRI